jgi:hypothetical protein
MKFGAMVATKIDDWKLLVECEQLGYDHGWVPDSQMIWSDCYATLALATDYDVWHESEEAVTVEMVVANMHQNVARAQAVIRAIVPLIVASHATSGCSCESALAGAIMTANGLVPPDTRRRLGVLLDKYLPQA